MVQGGIAPSADFVGAKVCSECHAKEYEQWQGSHHDLAMQPLAMQAANDQTVPGNFEDSTFSYNRPCTGRLEFC